MQADIAIEKITATEGLQAIRPEWHRLWCVAHAATPFSSPDWLIPWWDHLGRGKLSVLALRYDGRLIGLVPWVELQHASHPRLALLGERNSDYLDAPFEAAFEQAGMAAVLEWMQSTGWSRCEFTDLAECAPLLSVHPPDGWQHEIVRQQVCPVLELRADADLQSVLPSPQFKKLTRCRLRAQLSADMRVERATEENLPRLIGEFFRLHQTRWAECRQPGVLASPQLEKFHFEAASGFLRQDMLRLYLLSLAGRSAAAIYTFMHRRRAYLYLGGFDPEYKALSPGTLLIGYAIEQALAEHAEAVDFLRGNESYKYAWGAVDRPTYRRAFFRQQN